MCSFLVYLTGYAGKFSLVVIFVTILTSSVAWSGWQVIPIRLEFDQRTRSGVVTIKNDNDAPISFTVEGREWTQDVEGEDLYTETSDILFFPKQLTIGPHQERIIRAGIKVPALQTEKTYRLFIKQEANPEESSGSQVAIVIRFGVPIFAKPSEEHVIGEIVATEIGKGTFKTILKNTGNVHFRVKSVQLTGFDSTGEEVYSEAVNGNYLLEGSQRVFSAPLSRETCDRIDSLEIQVVSERIQLNGKLHVDKAMCASQ
jgi:fimbrial chaperone protein